MKGSLLALAVLFSIPRLFSAASPGEFDMAEASACLGLLALYGALRPLFSRTPLSRRLALVVLLAVTSLLLVRTSVSYLPGPGIPPGPVPFTGPGPRQDLVSRSAPIEVQGTIDSLARDGGDAIRSLGLFSGSGTVGTTMGALGEVTSTTAEVLIRTVYSGSNVVREDSATRPMGSVEPVPGIGSGLALAGAALAAVLLLIQVRYLVLVERKRRTLGRFRVLVCAVFLQVLYVSLGLDALIRDSISVLGDSTRMLLSVSPFYVLLIVYSIINGFRVKWIHYLNRWRKYMALAGAVLMLVLSQSVLTIYYSGRLTNVSVALGGLVGCVATALFFYSTVTAVSILLHLPSARLVDRKLEQLRILDGLGQSLYSTFEEDRIVSVSISLGRRISGADMCWAVRLGESAFQPWKDENVRNHGGVPDLSHAWYSELLLQLRRGDGTLLLNRYPASDLAGLATGVPVGGSLLASLLHIRKKSVGIMIAVTDRQYGFMTESRGLFTTFARQVAAAVENSRLMAYQLEQERYHEELAIARSIQEGLLPGELPVFDRFDIAGTSVPSSQVGGDYYDVFSLPGGLCAFAIADVAGKGTAAALLMAALESALHAIAPGMGTDAGGIVDRLNRLMSERMPSDKFITFFYGVLDPSTGEVSYCCAGHDPPMLLRAGGTTELLSCGGLVLGVLDRAEYMTGRVSILPGDRLVLYTDGITETMDAEGGEKEFGVPGLERFLSERSGMGSSDLMNALLEVLGEYRGDAPAMDDMTLLIIGGASGSRGGSSEGLRTSDGEGDR